MWKVEGVSFDGDEAGLLQLGDVSGFEKFRDHNTQVLIKRNESAVKCLVVEDIEADTVRGISTTLFALAPWNNVAGNEKL